MRAASVSHVVFSGHLGDQRNCDAISFCGDVSAFGCDRSFHEENETNEYDGDYGKNKKDIEVRKSRRLLFTQIRETL